jgi:hypothetical protein
MSAGISQHGKRLIAILGMAFVVCVGQLAAAGAAQADFGITGFGVRASTGGHFGGFTENEEMLHYSPGTLALQAGEHADLVTKLNFSGADPFRDLQVDLPPGLIGNPTAVDQCPVFDLTAGEGRNAVCPSSSQVGVIGIENDPEIYDTITPTPIYNITPPVDLPALFAFNYQGVLVFLEPNLRPTDYGISVKVRDASIGIELHASYTEFWGVPNLASHNIERDFGKKKTPEGKRQYFLTNPTSCPSAPSLFSAEVSSWQDPTVRRAETTDDLDGVPLRWEGCNKLPFDPTMRVEPGAHGTAKPTGLDVTVNVPQAPDADSLSAAHVRKVKVALPEGFALSAAAAAGIGGCSEAELGIGTNKAPTCPGSSQLGTVKVKTPVLEEELDGEIFFARDNENPFGSLIAFYLAIKGPGFWVKLPGKVDTDPATGQVTTTFDNLPQVPFEYMRLQFRGGAKAPLVSPDQCGDYVTRIEITSWASAIPKQLESPLTIDENCDTGGFDPQLHAGSTNPIAGSNTPFNVQFVRVDGEQNISRIETTLPPGLVASLRGVPLCEGAAAAAGTCAAGSEIGSLTIGNGKGPQPLFLPEPGKPGTHIYFGGPYKGAPYSMVFVVPAQAGPFDLGIVVVRAAVYLNPTTAQVTIKSDPMPQLLEGVPIDYRDLRIEITKPSFTLNPTNCNPKRFESTVVSDQGALATPSARFQVSDCAVLDFTPKLSLALKGPTRRAKYPSLRAVLTQKPGQANLARVATTLPHSEFLANEHIRTICTRVQYAANNCPANAVYGRATAYSPILSKPISGPVYLRSSDHPLPDLVADLGGEIDIDLVGRIDSVNGRIRTTFETVPDAPVSRFVLAMQGGGKSLLVNSTNICRSVHRAKVAIDGQNGKTADQSPKLRASCGKSKKQKRRH